MASIIGSGGALEVFDLTKRFNGLVAVDHISFHVDRGEFFGFLGPNGAGKTTTTRMLTGVIKPDAGKASVMGYDIRGEHLKAKQLMGIVPELANAYIDLSAWQNLMFLGELYGVPKKRRCQRAKELLRRLGLYERRNQLVKGFSKGMKQRLLICMALLHDPTILFLDEPTVGLDVQSARLIRDMLRDLNKGGTTVFLTTHNMEEANQLCDRVAIINHGRIAAIDSPEKLRANMAGLHSVEVAFDMAVDTQFLSKLPGVNAVRKVGDKVQLFTCTPGDLIGHIVDYVRSNDLRLLTLNVLAPSLEDVFIKLTERGK